MGPDEQCLPNWYPGECPYGTAFPGDVTIPASFGVFKLIAVFYGVLPYAVVLCNIIELLIKRGTRQLSLLVLSGLITLSNEFVFKKLIVQPRPGSTGELRDERGLPVGSCLITCGMPSSHAVLSVGFLVLMICDGIYRVVPSKEELEIGVDKALRCRCGSECFKIWCSSTPLVPMSPMSHKEFVVFFLAWFMLLGPVPIMRMRVYDHSADQVIVGSAIGFFWGTGWFALTQFISRRWSTRIGGTVFCGLLKHDFRPSEFRVKLHDHKDIVGSVVMKGAEIIAATDEDLKGNVFLRGAVQLTPMGTDSAQPGRRSGSPLLSPVAESSIPPYHDAAGSPP